MLKYVYKKKFLIRQVLNLPPDNAGKRSKNEQRQTKPVIKKINKYFIPLATF